MNNLDVLLDDLVSATLSGGPAIAIARRVTRARAAIVAAFRTTLRHEFAMHAPEKWLDKRLGHLLKVQDEIIAKHPEYPARSSAELLADACYEFGDAMVEVGRDLPARAATPIPIET